MSYWCTVLKYPFYFWTHLTDSISQIVKNLKRIRLAQEKKEEMKGTKKKGGQTKEDIITICTQGSILTFQ